MSSTTTTVSMNARKRSGKRGPTSASSAERERGVGRHRDPPAVCGRAPGVESEVDRDRHRHAAERREQRQREAPPLAQLAEVELAARLEADDEEEERHQPAVHPLAKIQRDPRAAEVDRQLRGPERARTTRRRRSPRRAQRRPPPARPPRRRSRCAGTPAAASPGSAPTPSVPRTASVDRLVAATAHCA